MRSVLGRAACGVTLLATAAGATGSPEPLRPVVVVGDAIPASLTGTPGDPARGRAIVGDRTRGLCLLCHAGPFPEVRFQGNLGPDLSGVGARRSAGELRLRLVDGRRLDPETIMPAYYSLDGLARVGTAWQGRPILEPDAIEDVVAFLTTLRDAAGTDRAEP
ncbi:sulfur oxidation c-type cytochrome SoxX [uncultured Methylobacterium sp.]|uniref:sulfur oxidation c-type cytochrome SoxX n=1 Tax=uncultured Methylobacterium sp. TaxID=157278 RepID=UPI0035CB36CF